MEFKDLAVVVATLLGPVLAIQASEFLQRRRQRRHDQLKVFTQLMSTRATRTAAKQFEALNLIDIVFYGHSGGEKEVRRLWKQYLDHLSDKAYPKDSWFSRQTELLVELLHGMANHLGYDFDRTEIKNQTYFPEGHGDLEQDQLIVRKAITEIVSGKRPFPIVVTNLHSQETDKPKP